MKNKLKVLTILAFIAFGVGIGSLISMIVFEIVGYLELVKIFGIVVAISGPISILLFIMRFYIATTVNSNRSSSLNSGFKNVEKEVKTVDVKPIKKTKEEEFYERYEDLYNKNLISKEDLDNKRKELLGK